MTLRNRIVTYWSGAGLSCPVSSTSSADPLIAGFDNKIENIVLDTLLSNVTNDSSTGLARGYALDVGAGYGRFTNTFLSHFKKVCLLEGASSIYAELLSQWSGRKDVICLNGVFEDLKEMPIDEFRLIFASGILYLYDDENVNQFFSKVKILLSCKMDSRIILRDFVCPTNQVFSSKFVEGGFCHYRDENYWRLICRKHDLELVKIIRSKPEITFFRSKIFNTVASRLKIREFIFNSKRMYNLLWRHGGWSCDSNKIHTVFIEIKRNVHHRC